jgi:HNH endonuclease
MTRVPTDMPLAERLAFYSRPDASGCRIWKGSTDGRMGYGKLRWRGKMQYAHRLVWELRMGSIPPGLIVRHSCDIPACIAIDHLLLGTQAENVADCFERNRASVRTGEFNNSAKLSWPIVREIRARRGAGLKLQEIADLYGISMSQAHNIVSNKQWKEDAA